MAAHTADTRSEKRKLLDEQVAAEPLRPPPDLPADATPKRIEDLLPKSRKPVAVLGVVENGVVRPLDPQVKLPEHSRVIIVAQEPI